jgi:biopolymer transport protein ExbB/TolQ
MSLLLLQEVPWAGKFERPVLWILSLVTLSIGVIIVAKLKGFAEAKNDTELYLPEVAKLLAQAKWDEALKISSEKDSIKLHFDKDSLRSDMAQLITDGLKERASLTNKGFQPELVIKHMEQAMERAKLRLLHRSRRWLSFLDAIGLTSPFIGALGGTGRTLAFGTALAILVIYFATYLRNRTLLLEVELSDAVSLLSTHIEIESIPPEKT